jgi:Polynucleotide kinase 3 phosphatase.
MAWRSCELNNVPVCVVRMGNLTEKPVAIFDIFGTIIWSDRGAKTITNENKWVFTSPDVPRVLSKYNKTHNVVLIDDVKGEFVEDILMTAKLMDNVVAMLDFQPFVVLSVNSTVARNNDYIRPGTAMWNFVKVKYGFQSDETSFYCGDSLGFDKPNPLYRQDNLDLVFSSRLKLKLLTPDKVFSFDFPLPEKEKLDGNIIVVLTPHPVNCEEFWPKLVEHMNYDSLNDIKFSANLTQLSEQLKNNEGKLYVVQSNNLLKRDERNVVINYSQGRKVYIFWFTRPFQPFIHNPYDANIYIANLEAPIEGQEIGEIIRIN